MIDVNLNNYEEYIVDYFDVNLNSLEEKALMSFLNKNPQLQEEFYTFKNTNLSSENIIFNNKEILKKDFCLLNSKESNFNELCVAKIEGDLLFQQEIDFDRMLNADLRKKKEFELFALTKIIANNKIVFKNKKKLKRNTKTKAIVIYSFISAAATVLLLIGLYSLMPKTINIVSEKNISKTISNVKGVIIKDENNLAKKNTLKVKNYIIKEISIKNINPPIIAKIKEKKKEENIYIKRSYYNQLSFLQAKDIKIKEGTVNKKEFLNIHYIKNYSGIVNKDEYTSPKSFLSETIKNKFFNKKKDKIEVFDIAQAGVKGVNKLLGSKMTLERIYDINGNPDKTEFNSRLIAFSAPIKK